MRGINGQQHARTPAQGAATLLLVFLEVVGITAILTGHRAIGSTLIGLGTVSLAALLRWMRMTQDHHPTAEHASVPALQEHASAIKLPEWPVYTLANEDQSGWLSGAAESSGSGVESIRLSYRAPGGAERIVVDTRLLRQGVDLRHLLSWVECGDDDEYFSSGDASHWPSTETLTDHPTDTDVVITGTTFAATVWRTQTASAWQVQTDQVTISVAARGVALTALELIEVRDLRPYQQRRASNVAAYLAKPTGGSDEQGRGYR